MSYKSKQKILSVEVYPKGWLNWSQTYNRLRLFPDVTTAGGNSYATHGDRTKVINTLGLAVGSGQYLFVDGDYKMDIEFSMKYATNLSARLQALKEGGYVRLYGGGGTVTQLSEPAFNAEDTENTIDATHNVMSFKGTQYIRVTSASNTRLYLQGFSNLGLGSTIYYTFKNTATLIEGKDV